MIIVFFIIVYLVSAYLLRLYYSLAFSSRGIWSNVNGNFYDMFLCLCPVFNTICAMLFWSLDHPIEDIYRKKHLEKKLRKKETSYNWFFGVKK